MKTKEPIFWNRLLGFSYNKYDNIPIPKGSPVIKAKGKYWIDPNIFLLNSGEYHDAFYYGIIVNPDNVEHE